MIDVKKIKPGDWMRDVQSGELAILAQVTDKGQLQIWKPPEFGYNWSKPSHYETATPTDSEARAWLEGLVKSLLPYPVRWFDQAEDLADKSQALLEVLDPPAGRILGGKYNSIVEDFKKVLRIYQASAV